MRKRRPTIIDVAERAKVSKSTAARALSGAPNVAEDVRAHVAEVAALLGYERNVMAVGMRSGRSNLLGLVIPDIANTFWAEVARGAQDRAMESGASLLVFSSDWDGVREAKHLRTLKELRVDGAIVNPVADGVIDLQRFGLNFVLVGSSAGKFPSVFSVGSDIHQGVTLALDHMLEKGHAKSCFILGSDRRLARARFLRAVHDHCVARDIDPALLEAENADYTVQGGFDAMKRLLARERVGHVSVVCANDLMALGALLAAREVGLDCPRDVSIMGFDGIPAGAFAHPGLTTVEKPARDIGRHAADYLLDAQPATAAGDAAHLPCRLIERGSVRDLAAERLHRPVAKKG